MLETINIGNHSNSSVTKTEVNHDPVLEESILERVSRCCGDFGVPMRCGKRGHRDCRNSGV